MFFVATEPPKNLHLPLPVLIPFYKLAALKVLMINSKYSGSIWGPYAPVRHGPSSPRKWVCTVQARLGTPHLGQDVVLVGSQG